ncbi:hypothetical protein R1flu_004274 [Riccia fluitans]|uniref:Myb-like domain-containing protein n=1 Tax=Riccia fluitans TaxID=41844 RepID=A0ABD1YPU2_9MARC
MIGENLAIMAPLPPLQASPMVSGEIAAVTPGRGRRKEDRIPQWGYHETKEFIAIRAELEKDFTQTKRNKTLWELIAGKMKEKGFRRSADQCKCKWKNLVNRYKGFDEASDFSPLSQFSARVDDELASEHCVIGKETSEPDNGRQCAFFEELDAIFKERAKNMDRLLLESESGSRPKKKARRAKRILGGVKSSDDDTEEDEDEEVDSEDERIVRRKKRKADKERQRVTAEKYRANSMQEVLEDFFQQQQRVEDQWRESMERREQERRMREHEWRDAMAKLEQERLLREQEWREREDQRRAREEARAEKRDDLFAALISRLTQQDG